MSVTFSIRGREIDWDSENPTGFVNVSNSNAYAILETLGIPVVDGDLYGECRGGELQDLCKGALIALGLRGGDKRIPTYVEANKGHATVFYCGRPAGYLSERISQLLELATEAGDLGVVMWG